MLIKKCTLLGALLILLILGATGMAVYLIKKQVIVTEGPPVVLEPEEEVSKEPEEISTAPEIDTSGWNTYTNEEYGFEMKYPKEWIAVTGHDGLNVGFKNSPGAKVAELWIEEVQIPEGTNLRSYLEKKFDYSSHALSTLVPTEIDGYQGYYIKEPGLEGWYHSLYFDRDGTTLHLGARPRVTIELFSAIINTITIIPGGR